MCGILGHLTLEGAPPAEPVFAWALAQIAHRGPDDFGTWRGPAGAGGAHLALGHRRLSILDLSSAGHQPLVSSRTGSVLVYNGEIYNFRELRAELTAAGCKFVSDCDTEVLLAAYDVWGEACMPRLNGMFAFALWDAPNQRLVMGRDRLGIKPFYYYWDGQRCAISSEVTALAAFPDLDLEIDHAAVEQFLTHGYITAPLSIYRKVRKLEAGMLGVVDAARGTLTLRRYWDALDHYGSSADYRSEEEVLDAIETQLRQAVRRRLVSDVSLGAFLSGGIDSTLVVALMQAVHDGPVRTFTVGFEEPAWDEAPMARQVAVHLGTDHAEFYLSEANVLALAPEVADWYDEPFADSSSLPTLALSRLTRQHVTVALSGDGGDELFYGYRHYRFAVIRYYRMLSMAPQWLRRPCVAALRSMPIATLARWGHLLDFHDFASLYVKPGVRRGWMVPDLHRGNGKPVRLEEMGREVVERLAGRPTDLVTSAIDLRGWLVDDILTKVDRASMSVALEVRVPFLDHEMVEMAVRIPSAMRRRGGELKYLLRRVLARHVPRALWDRPKSGFGVPLRKWFRTALRDWSHDELLGANSPVTDLLDRDALATMLALHNGGQDDYSRLIWACLQLAGWQRRVARIRAGGHGVAV